MNRPFTFDRVESFAARDARRGATVGLSNRAARTAGRAGSGTGFTIVEVLVATALTLMMMAAVVAMFGRIGTSVTEARSTLEMSDRLRATAVQLQRDLAGATATTLPPRRPETNEGYFEYIEGPVGVALKSDNTTLQPWDVAVNSTDNVNPNQPDTTVIDFDDILMFTTRSSGRPFVGRHWDPVANQQSAIESDVAEVAWFVRGRTLYRRLLLVAPAARISSNPNDLPGVSTQRADPRGFYGKNDISASVVYDATGTPVRLVANTLADLTRRECRFAHPAVPFPFDARRWGQLGLPTLRECSSPNWDLSNPPIPNIATINGNLPSQLDFWSNDATRRPSDRYLVDNYLSGNDGSRIAEDVILTNVIGFDVKAYDPGAFDGAGGYVDLGYENKTYVLYLQDYYASPPPQGIPWKRFSHLGMPSESSDCLNATMATARVYDTFSSHYETVGRYPGDTQVGWGVNGFDNTNSGVVGGTNQEIKDNKNNVVGIFNMIAPPPYPVPLRGIQVKLRVFEPDSRQVREVTVVQDFLPK